MHDDHEAARIADVADRREVAQRVVRRISRHVHAEHQITDTDETDGIPIGRGLGDEIRTDYAVGAGPRIDHYILFDDRRDFVGQRTCRILRKARAHGDKAQGFGGEGGLPDGRFRQCRNQNQRQH